MTSTPDLSQVHPLIESAPLFRLAAFSVVLVIMGLLEYKNPKRVLSRPKPLRWINNFALSFGSSLLTRLIFPLLAVGAAVQAQVNGWGLLNWISAPMMLNIVASIILMDMIIYWQHRASHLIPVLWRLHRVHHADVNLDLSSGSRFHPLEISLSMGLKIISVTLLGVSPEGVIAFEIILNISAMFNHANWNHSKRFDQLIRPLMVTPDMHRIHHSVIQLETDSNYGFFLSVWDRLFGSYREEPTQGQLGMVIGIEEFRHPSEVRLDKILTQPFRNK